jgi:16S rRNA (guanine966-N2)-methyltransferase
MQEMPDLALPHLDTDGVFTLEHSSHDWFDEHPHLMTSRSYGRTIVSLFRPPLPPKEEDEASDESGSDEAVADTAATDDPAGGSPAAGSV